MNTTKILNNIEKQIRDINYKIDNIIYPTNTQKNDLSLIYKPLEFLFKLPTHLHTTILIMLRDRNREFSAQEMSNITVKQRAVESRYLNELVALGWVIKSIKGRKMYFTINNHLKNLP